ncbi:hypothetical protein BHE74_00009295 [Ensete ventricosum]|nr:hypothetical protein BHE74_00009295 [Ensete ventricosum]
MASRGPKVLVELALVLDEVVHEICVAIVAGQPYLRKVDHTYASSNKRLDQVKRSNGRERRNPRGQAQRSMEDGSFRRGVTYGEPHSLLRSQGTNPPNTRKLLPALWYEYVDDVSRSTPEAVRSHGPQPQPLLRRRRPVKRAGDSFSGAPAPPRFAPSVHLSIRTNDVASWKGNRKALTG